MNSHKILVPTCLLAAGVLGMAAGCARRPIIVQSPAPTVINQQPVSTPATPTLSQREIVILHDAPPAPKVETPSAQPSPENIWIGGYWGVQGNERVWVGGHWENPPRAGAVWVAPRWEKRGDGYAFIEGSWR